MRSYLILGLFCLLSTRPFHAQNTPKSEGVLHGNVQIDAQFYNQDSVIGAVVPSERLASNSFANLIYQKGKFTGGLRYEAYLPALQGFSPRYEGSGITYRFAKINLENLVLTAGNFYDQFGSGMIFRSYEERGLGYDNAMDGIHALYKPVPGIQVKAMVGKQRLYFDKGAGIVRGLDAEVSLNDLVDSIFQNVNIRIGASLVSKYQSDNSSVFNLPENVSSFAGRTNISGQKFRISTEYVYKINDPSADNGFIYKPGNAFIGQASYFVKGFGLSLDVKRIDNMSFRSEREAGLSDVLINYSPSFTRQHTYNLLATLYPYATQLNGEIGGQFELQYRVKKGTLLGGKYGTSILCNYSTANGLETKSLDDEATDRRGYTASLFRTGEKYYQDFNVEVTKKINKRWKGIFTYANLQYNKDILEGKTGYGLINAQVVIADMRYKIKSKHTIRGEVQGMFTAQDQGDWATLLLEYSYAPHWFFAVMDQYNYGNKEAAKQVHYYIGSMGYTANNYRIVMNYGRQRAGIFCVGGVCRNVPAANGLSVSITSNF